jgi:hypothetical protein
MGNEESRSKKRKHGFSKCATCKAVLMAYLERGHNFEEVCEILAKNHPEIVDIRKYARNAIRETTGFGIYDDYILKHKLWPLRKPFLTAAPGLEKVWAEQAANGERIITARGRFEELMKDPGNADAIGLLLRKK